MTDEQLGWLRSEFERCAPWIQEALDRDLGLFELEDVWDMIETGKVSFWPLPKGAIVPVIEYFPRKVVLRYWLCGGEANASLDQCISTTERIEKWARDAGATMSIIGGREGWLRKLPGYEKKFVVLTKDL